MGMNRLPGMAAAVCMLLSTVGCASFSGGAFIDPIDVDPDAQINVAGTYRWGFVDAITEGMITFSQDGQTVTVDGIDYILQPQLRDLTGSADLAGNTLDISLVPKDGTAYQADVVLTFSADTERFTAEFDDTNDDVGVKVGVRLDEP